ncbi:MAG: PmoA family protein, partial [Phycisphaerales bacterium]
MPKPVSIVIGSIFVLLLSSCLLSPQSVGGERLGRITVDAGDYTRIDTPVSLDLSGVPLGFPGDEMRLVEVKGSQRIEVPVQLEAGSPPRLWWVLSGTTKAGNERTYELVEGSARSVSGVSAKQDPKVLQIQKDGIKVLNYNHAIVPAPAGQSELYNRGGFIHPLWSPTGSVLTNIHPKDHYHHLGIWMPWTNTVFEGEKVDFWNLGGRKDEDIDRGTVRFSRFLSTTSGPVYGGFQAEQDHVALETSSGEKVVLKEVWDVRVYNVGGRKKGYWLWDLVSAQRCVAESPLRLLEYHYGGFGFRGAAEWHGDKAAYLTSEGKTRKDGHKTRARWCDTAGISDGKWKGVTHFSHPENFRHPEPMRIWPEFEKEVFFNWAPEQLGDFEMKPGEDHIFCYRLYVHEGKVDVENTERLWNDYAHPPKVEIETAGSGDAIML